MIPSIQKGKKPTLANGERIFNVRKDTNKNIYIEKIYYLWQHPFQPRSVSVFFLNVLLSLLFLKKRSIVEEEEKGQ